MGDVSYLDCIGKRRGIHPLRLSCVIAGLLLGCGPSVEPTDGGGEGGGDGGGETTAGGPGGSESGVDDDDGIVDSTDNGAPGCGLTQEFGAPLVIEVVNNREVDVRLQGEGCDPPLRLFADGTQFVWAPDCGTPRCPADGERPDCGVCDCGQVLILLAPGESTTFEWVGNSYDMIQPEAECSFCGGPSSCWLASLVAEGTYSAVTEFSEFCQDPDPKACSRPALIEQATVTFDYPGDSVLLSIE